MRRVRRAVTRILLLGIVSVCSVQMALAEVPGDWSSENYSQFMEQRMAIPSELQSGEYISALITGDYQCEARITLKLDQYEDVVHAESLVAIGTDVQSQMDSLRAAPTSKSQGEIFAAVRLKKQATDSVRHPQLKKLWNELESIRIPVVPGSGMMSPGVHITITSWSIGEQSFDFFLPSPSALNIGYILPTSDPVYNRLGDWIRRVLTAIGGAAKHAARGGDCAA